MPLRKFLDSPRRNVWMGMALFGALTFVVGEEAVCYVQAMRQSYDALQWEERPVERVERQVHQSSGFGRHSQSILWIGHYVYGENAYTTDRKGCGEFDSDRSTGRLDEWRVYVNPSDPSEAVMSRGGSALEWVKMAALVLGALASGFIFVLLVWFYRYKFAGKSARNCKKLHTDAE